MREAPRFMATGVLVAAAGAWPLWGWQASVFVVGVGAVMVGAVEALERRGGGS